MKTGRLAIVIHLRRENLMIIGEPANKFAFIQIFSEKVIIKIYKKVHGNNE
jgi:hypothetical protein